MKAIAYNVKPQEKEWLVLANAKQHDITIIANHLSVDTISFARGKEVLLLFNQDIVSAELILLLKDLGVKYIAMASHQTNHIDLQAATKAGLKCANVSPSHQVMGFEYINQVIKNLNQWATGNSVSKAFSANNGGQTNATNI